MVYFCNVMISDYEEIRQILTLIKTLFASCAIFFRTFAFESYCEYLVIIH